MNEKLNSADAAREIGVTPGTLEIWRCTKRTPQPTYLKVGSKVWYLKKDLDAYLESVRVVV